MSTADLVESIRYDIKRDLMKEIMAELKPEIERQLNANIFTFSEAAKYRKVSERTLRRMVADNEVPFFRQRNNIYFRQVDLDRNISKLVERK